jgi:hypothetical protein
MKQDSEEALTVSQQGAGKGAKREESASLLGCKVAFVPLRSEKNFLKSSHDFAPALFFGEG